MLVTFWLCILYMKRRAMKRALILNIHQMFSFCLPECQPISTTLLFPILQWGKGHLFAPCPNIFIGLHLRAVERVEAEHLCRIAFAPKNILWKNTCLSYYRKQFWLTKVDYHHSNYNPSFPKHQFHLRRSTTKKLESRTTFFVFAIFLIGSTFGTSCDI